jgi:formylglycine-generating enzyme required for sulfatase activity
MPKKPKGRGRAQENSEPQSKPLTLFYSYSHKDEALREKLEEHLAVLGRRGLITAWHDREIRVGGDWKGQIDQNLDSADIILLLVSPSFLASDYCWDKEMNRALERHEEGEARVIPIILRPCLWLEGPLAKLQAEPKDARPVTQWQNTDEAFLDVATALRRVISELQQERASIKTPIIKQRATAAAVTASSKITVRKPAHKRRNDPGAAPQKLPDLAVFRDVDAPWCPELVIVPAGEFMMGSPDPNYTVAHLQRPVVIGYRFAVGRYPVTFEEYDYFCEAAGKWKPDDRGWGRGRRPVMKVNWKDAKAYCEWLSQVTGKQYRLPSESEWEYACRAGTTTKFAFGDSISTSQARYGLTAWSTVEVGSYQPNLWGIFDMHGNVEEWVEDVWKTKLEAPEDGSPQLQGETQEDRVTRGGGFRNLDSGGLWSFWRGHSKYMESSDGLGFRVVRTL